MFEVAGAKDGRVGNDDFTDFQYLFETTEVIIQLLLRLFAEQLGEGLEVQDVRDVWLGWTNEPNHHEDVTATFAAKIDALARHESQLTEGIAFFEGFLLEEAKGSGEQIGVDLAEPFRVLDLT